MVFPRNVLPGDGTYGNGAIDQRGQWFRVRWRENGVRKTVSRLKSHAEAVDKLAVIQARLRLGQPGLDPALPSPAVSDPAPERTFAELMPE